jgi:predicted lipoprotein with Yx(FWY)xxD motif
VRDRSSSGAESLEEETTVWAANAITVILVVLAMAGEACAAPDAPLATPTGVTFQPLGAPQGYGAQRMQLIPRLEVVYADAGGLTLYTYDKDGPGKSNCTDNCASTWLPLTPIINAKPVPGWTIVSRGDGRKQWAHLGMPLYTFKGDREGGDVMGRGAPHAGSVGAGQNIANAVQADNAEDRGSQNVASSRDNVVIDNVASADNNGGGINAGEALTAKLPSGWHVHKLTTRGKFAVPLLAPFGFEVKEVTDAEGVALVDVRDGVLQKVLYVYSGDVNHDQRLCASDAKLCPAFAPVEAPQIASSDVPDWTIIERRDGIRQWAYKGQALYTYEGDRVTGDVHGRDKDKRWQVALVSKYFRPTNIRYRDDPNQGMLLTTNKGFTLYRRDLDAFLPVGTRVAHDYPYRPRVGRMTRRDPCDATCQKEWKPYLAPEGAHPNGYWGIAILSGGRKQWTYKDFALFTYTGDLKPGDNFGNLIYDVRLSDDPNVNNEVGFPSLYKAGFNWGVARF